MKKIGLKELTPIGLSKKFVNEEIPSFSLDAETVFSIYDAIVVKHPEFKTWFPNPSALYFYLQKNLKK